MQLAEPKVRKWTRDEYYQMADLGFFQGQRVELIDGEIIEMAPQKDVHAAVVSLTHKALSRAFPSGHWVRMQLPLYFDNASEPEPDVAVVPGSERDYIGTDHPRTALLVVEVSDTTLRYDRGPKSNLYAAAGIPEYWIVDVKAKQLEVRRKPVADAAQPRGHRYDHIEIFQSGQSVVPMAAPQSPVPVADLLP